MIDHDFITLLWQQFGAAIDMLENAVVVCPDDVWEAGKTPHAFWYISYHTLFWLDFYLHDSPEPFAPPPPYTLGELDPAGVYPERIYSQAELLDYLEHCRTTCRLKLAALTDEQALQKCEWNPYKRDFTVFELHLYNLRHVQHHAGQLNLLLRQHIDAAPRWVSRAQLNLTDQ
jgi:hypothetical protein